MGTNCSRPGDVNTSQHGRESTIAQEGVMAISERGRHGHGSESRSIEVWRPSRGTTRELKPVKIPLSEAAKTTAAKSILPIGEPRKPTVSSIPSQIAFVRKVSKVGRRSQSMAEKVMPLVDVQHRPQSKSFTARSRYESGEYVSSFSIGDLFPDPEEEADILYSPLSLVELCLRTICHYTRDWLDESGNSKINLAALPPELTHQLFEMVRSHKLLKEDLLAAFQHCDVAVADLAQYPGVKDSWVPVLASFASLRALDLSHCRQLTDEGFRNISILGYNRATCKLENLSVESCTMLTDASVALVVHSLSKTLLELNLSGCAKITDASLARIVQCRKLCVLGLNRCQLLSATYLCQIALLHRLRSLDLSLISSVNDVVLAALRPSTSVGAPYAVAAIEVTFGCMVSDDQYSPSNLNTLPEDTSEELDNGVERDRNYDEEVTSGHQMGDLEYEVDDSEFNLEGTCQESGRENERNLSNHRPLKMTQQKPSKHTSKSIRKILRPLKARLHSKTKLSPPSSPSSSTLSGDDASAGRFSLSEAPIRMEGVCRRNQSTKLVGDLASLRAQLACVQVAGLRDLRHLNVSYCSVTDDGCAHIGRFKKLVSLHIEQNGITHRGVHHLSPLGNLEEVNMSHCEKLRDGAAELTSLSSIRALNLAYVQVSRFDTSVGLANLESLNLSNTAFSERYLAGLAKGAPKLRELKLEECRISSRGMEYIGQLVGLEVLSLSDTGLRDRALIPLINLVNLRDLNLFQCTLTPATAGKIFEVVNNIETLNFDLADLTSLTIRALKNLHHLKHLDLFGASVNDNGCLEISKAGLTKLETLNLCGGFVTDVGVSYIAAAPFKLSKLNLSQNSQITDAGIKRLAESFGLTLKSLSLSNTKITAHSVTLFYSFVFLEELIVRGCGLSEISMRVLRETMPNLWFILS